MLGQPVETTAEIPEALAGERLDRVVSVLTGLPRSDAAALVAAGSVRIGDKPVTRGARRVARGEVVRVASPPVRESSPRPDPGVPVHVVHEDAWLIVVDKPPGVVVHPGAGNTKGTLVNALLARYPELAGVGDPDRPGIVHRLDKGTSGLLVVARTPEAHRALVGLLAGRRIERTYLTLVAGSVDADQGVVDAPVGRSSRQPTRMAVTPAGREARTRYRVLARYAGYTLLECSLETGRTHQIRVHMNAIGHPVAGDPTYGKGARGHDTARFPRPFLHAHRLVLDHPAGTGRLELESPLPDDLRSVLDSLD